MPDEVKPIDQSVAAVLPVETKAEPVQELRPTQHTYNEIARKAAWEAVFGAEGEATVDATATNPTPVAAPVSTSAPTTINVAPPQEAPPVVKAPVQLSPVEVASSWIQSPDPERQKLGWEMLERVKAASAQQAALVQPTGPDWDKRATDIRDEIINSFKTKFTERKPALNQFGEEIPGAFVEESSFDETNPLFKEVIDLRAEQKLEKEIAEFNRKQSEQQHQQQSFATIRQQHEDRTARAYSKGLILPDGGNTATLFPKAADGTPNPKAVKLWHTLVAATLQNKEFIKATQTELRDVPEAELSKHVIAWAWRDFADHYDLNKPPETQVAAPVGSAKQPEQPVAKVPTNLLGAVNASIIDNKPATPQSQSDADIDRSKFRTTDPISPEYRNALRESWLAQINSGG